MCESDNKIIVLNRAGWINKDRILFYNYELQYKDNAPEKFCTREEMCKKYKLTRGSIHQLINDGKKGKDPSKRYKWKDFQIKAIHESRGCIIEDREVVNSKGEVVVKKCVLKKKVEEEQETSSNNSAAAKPRWKGIKGLDGELSDEE